MSDLDRLRRLLDRLKGRCLVENVSPTIIDIVSQIEECIHDAP